MILAGGYGTRLAPVLGNVAKGLAPIRGTPFLDLLLKYLIRHGISRVVFCVSHLREGVMKRYASWPSLQTAFSVEADPLGTGGALKHALDQVTSDRLFVLNGDSFCNVDLQALLQHHLQHVALATLSVASPAGRADIGSVKLGADSRVVSFREKAAQREGGYLMNAGVYAIERSAFEEVLEGRCSLEQDLIPRWVKLGRCFALETKEEVIDIGTPERYARAQERL